MQLGVTSALKFETRKASLGQNFEELRTQYKLVKTNYCWKQGNNFNFELIKERFLVFVDVILRYHSRILEDKLR